MLRDPSTSPKAYASYRIPHNCSRYAARPESGGPVHRSGKERLPTAKANASTDPTVSIDGGKLASSIGPTNGYIGLSVNIPLRIFDRNQGEILRTKLDITRNERLLNAAEAQLYGDVDSAYATIVDTVELSQPYKTQYLARAATVRDTVTFSYQRGGASLLDFLDATRADRAVQAAYLNLVGSYLSAVAQMNLAVGREVIE